MELIETDAETGARIYRLAPDERPTDNIYGEQPYGDSTGRHLVVRHYAAGQAPDGLSVVDLETGACRPLLEGLSLFPAFHAWGDTLYWQQPLNGRRVLRRCRLAGGPIEDVRTLPDEIGRFSYGTVSEDHRHYAVCVIPRGEERARLYLFDLRGDEGRLILDRPGYHAKHEQFSRDGRNRILIQLNQVPGIKQVLLGEVTLDGQTRLFAADQPHTPRPTGHETWVGTSSTVFFSTGFPPQESGTLWSAAAGESSPRNLLPGPMRFGHVSVSRDGRYWLADTSAEPGVPLYVGRFDGGPCRRAVFTRTVPTREQWSHAHPYFTADSRWLIFTSTRDGHPQVYGARLADGWL